MKIRTLDQVNSHWLDGRHFSAMAGSVAEVDDADAGAVAHFRHLVRVGLAELVKDEPLKPADDDEVSSLRARAAELGVKVDGRWTPKRLRAEVEAAEATTKDGD